LLAPVFLQVSECTSTASCRSSESRVVFVAGPLKVEYKACCSACESTVAFTARRCCGFLAYMPSIRFRLHATLLPRATQTRRHVPSVRLALDVFKRNPNLRAHTLVSGSKRYQNVSLTITAMRQRKMTKQCLTVQYILSDCGMG